MSSQQSHHRIFNKADLQDAHTPQAVRFRLRNQRSESYLGDFVFGAIDGTVTTFAVVTGVVGAGLAPEIILILGFANLVADGFSMAAGSFLATRANHHYVDHIRRVEQRHIESFPEGEREEIRQIYAQKGFEDEDLERAVEIITADRERWIHEMLQNEWGLQVESRPAMRAALVTFVSFSTLGTLPLIPFVWNYATPDKLDLHATFWSIVLTGAGFFAIGACKSKVVSQSWLREGVQTVMVGGVAAAIAFAIGWALRGLL